jgi:hypothetical protein
MQMDQQQQENKMFNPKAADAFNVLVAGVVAHATTITPFLRKGFGSKGKREGLALILLGLVAGFSGAPEFWGYLMVWMCVVALRRAETAAMRRKGWQVHSEYAGWPEAALRVGKVFGVRKEKTAKMVVEPLICLAVAIVFACVAENCQVPELYALAGWIGFGSLSLAFDQGIMEAVIDRRADVIRDSQIETEIVLERYREKYDR